MFESIARRCCNYNSGKCLGGLFKVENGQLVQWLDSSKAGKDCFVTKGKSCSFFNAVVIPGIPNNSSIRHMLAAYEHKAKIVSTGYKLICKLCGKEFYSTTKNKQYCDNCRVTIKKKNSKNSSKNHRIKHQAVHRVSM